MPTCVLTMLYDVTVLGGIFAAIILGIWYLIQRKLFAFADAPEADGDSVDAVATATGDANKKKGKRAKKSKAEKVE